MIIRHHVYESLTQAQSKYLPELVILTSLAAAGFALLNAPMVLRLPMGILAALFLPGYSLSLAIFPRATDLDGVERKALAVGLSLAVMISLGLALNYTPWGLRTTSIVVTLSGLTILLASIGRWRRKRLKLDEQLQFAVGHRGWPELSGMAKLMLTLVAASLLLAITSLVVTLSSQPGLTEFFVLGPEGLARDYPRTEQARGTVTIMMGITNREGSSETYSVSVYAGTETLVTVGPIEVPAGNTWQGPVGFALPSAGKDQEVTVKLFREGRSEPYRQLRLTLDALPAEGVR